MAQGKRWHVSGYLRKGKHVSSYNQRRHAAKRGTYYARRYRAKYMAKGKSRLNRQRRGRKR